MPFLNVFSQNLMLYGLLGGLMSGLVGSGGGVLMLLALRRILPHAPRQSFALSVTAMASLSLLIYATLPPPALSLAAPLLPSAIAGGVLGARGLFRLPTSALKTIFSLICLLGGVRMLSGVSLPFSLPLSQLPTWLYLALTALSGLVFSSLSAMGVGGGSLLLLWLTELWGVEVGAARGLNLLCFLLSSCAAIPFYRKQGLLTATSPLPSLLLGALPGALAGLQIASLLPGGHLRRLFGVFLALTGGWGMWKGKRDKAAG